MLLQKKSLKLWAWMIAFAFSGLLGIAQSQPNIDSLRNSISSSANIDSQYEASFDLSRAYRSTSKNLDSALYFVQLAWRLAQELDEPFKLAQSSNQTGRIYKDLLQYDSALHWYEKSLKIREEHHLKQKGIALVKNNLGSLYRQMALYGKALEAYDASLAIRQDMGDTRKMAILYNNMAIACKEWAQKKRMFGVEDSLSLKEERLALFYYQKSLEIWKELDVKKYIARLTYNITPLYIEWHQYDSALFFSQSSYRQYQQLEDSTGMADAISHMGLAYQGREDWRKALSLYQEALALRERHGSLSDKLVSYNNLGESYTALGQYQRGEAWLLGALVIADSLKLRNVIHLDLYRHLSETYAASGQDLYANIYLTHYHKLKDSLLYVETTREIASMTDFLTQQQLKTEKQEAELKEKVAKQETKLTIGIAVSSLFLLFMIAILVQRQQQTRHEFHIREKVAQIHEIERQFLHRQIDTNETSLKKIGRDLHDKLSGDLSSSIISLQTLRKGIKDWTSMAEKSFELMDNRLQESYEFVRGISHNIETWTFQESHLLSHIDNLCEILRSQEIEVQIVDLGIESLELPPLVKQHIARISQEAITNILVHAEASAVRIELRYEEGNIELRIIDNGKGFDPDNTRGFGLSSIGDRVHELGGSFFIESHVGEGTTLHIIYPV